MQYTRIRRIIAAAAVGTALTVLAGCRAGGANTSTHLAAPFVVPGATAITVTALETGGWQIRYLAPGSPSTWIAGIARQLEADGWSSPDQAAYSPLNRSFHRSTPVAVGEARQSAFMYLDPFEPQVARIRVRRSLDVPWWRRAKRLVSQASDALAP